jgi:monooxygenase
MTTHLDVLIVGAGLSGIGAACHLQNDAPGTTYAVLEARATSGGTWDLFRYPGVRSDSDMYTLGYTFQPWTRKESIAQGGDILDYIRTTARDHNVERHIRYSTRVVSAAFSTRTASWTVTVEVDGQTNTLTCGFLYLCSGFYRYDQGHTPTWPGREDFTGSVLHPQHWPTTLDLAGKNVVVVGSGATAVTLVPALAEQAATVTMLQRSPSYVLPVPTADPIATLLRKVLPEQRAYRAIRRKNVWTSTAIYSFTRKRPTWAKALLRKLAVRALPEGFDVDTHFTPAYDPWDQRMCMVPDGDFFRAIKAGRAHVVTDEIATFTPTGLRLRSGVELPADVVVTATGLNLLPLSGIELSVDGEPVIIPERVAYKGMMLDGVPNLAFALGYTNASWTLKVDLVSSWVARLIHHMRQHGQQLATAVLPDRHMVTAPYIEMTSGYFERSRAELPRQGDMAPWRLAQDYRKDAPMFLGDVRDDVLQLRSVDELSDART